MKIYAPCDIIRKSDLWDELSARIKANNGEQICVLGGFNFIGVEEEIKGATENNKKEEMEEFDGFILGSVLIDLPLCSREFTWSRLQGTSMSCLDMFWIAKGRFKLWPNNTQWPLDNGLLDHHCTIFLGISVQKGGLKPLCMLNY